MTFCCGASMIGTIGSLQTEKVFVHQVPIVYCPVCKTMQVHPSVQDEYEILVEFAEGDMATEVVFTDFIDLERFENLEDVCISWDEGHHEKLLQEQIDNALDLLALAKDMKDEAWEVQIKTRLKILSNHLNEWKKRKSELIR